MSGIVYVVEGDATSLIAALDKSTVALKRTAAAGDVTTAKVDKLGKKSAVAGTKVNRTKNILQAFKEAAEGAGGTAGENAGRIEKFGKAFTMLGPAGPVGAAAAALLAFGAAGVTAALKTSTLVKELDKLGRTDVLTAEQLGVVQDMDHEIQMLTLDLKEATVELGAKFAPAVLTVVTYARQAITAFEQWQEATDWIRKGGQTFRDAVSFKFLWGGIADEAARAAREGRAARNAITGFAYSQAQGSGPAPAATPRPTRIGGGGGRGRELAKADALAQKAIKANAEGRRMLLDLANEDQRMEERRIALIQERMVAEAALGQQLARQRAEEIRAMEQATQYAKEQQLQRVDAQLGAASAIMESVSMVTDHVIQAAEDGTDGQKKAALAAFRVSQGAAIAQIAINTAQAIMQSYGQLGPVAGHFAAAGMTTVGAVQAALVAAQAPPSFSQGGMVEPDHRTIAASPGEGVLSRTGVAALGGPDAVRSMNSGRGSGQGRQRIALQAGHRYYDAILTEHLERGGPIEQRVRDATEPIGHALVGA